MFHDSVEFIRERIKQYAIIAHGANANQIDIDYDQIYEALYSFTDRMNECRKLDNKLYLNLHILNESITIEIDQYMFFANHIQWMQYLLTLKDINIETKTISDEIKRVRRLEARNIRITQLEAELKKLRGE